MKSTSILAIVTIRNVVLETSTNKLDSASYKRLPEPFIACATMNPQVLWPYYMKKRNKGLVVQGRVEDTRARGRSLISCTHNIRTATSSSFTECSRNATNRSRWRIITEADEVTDLHSAL